MLSFIKFGIISQCNTKNYLCDDIQYYDIYLGLSVLIMHSTLHNMQLQQSVFEGEFLMNFFSYTLLTLSIVYCRISSRRLATLSRPISSDTVAPPLPSPHGNLHLSVPTSHVTPTRPSATITRDWHRSFMERRLQKKFKHLMCLV